LATLLGHCILRPKNLLELELCYGEPFTDVDANWITFAPLAKDGHIVVDDLQWVSRYWAGEKYTDHPVWERLAKGVALILDEHVRRRCYQYVRGGDRACRKQQI
jgi:hypothetical protein